MEAIFSLEFLPGNAKILYFQCEKCVCTFFYLLDNLRVIFYRVFTWLGLSGSLTLGAMGAQRGVEFYEL